MTEEASETNPENRKGGGCLRRLWLLVLVGLVLLAGLLVWLNGPGLRWLGPKVAEHFIEKAGMEGSLRLGGTLLGGVKVYDLEITNDEGALERLVVDRLETDYRINELIKGKLRGISGEGIHADIRMVPSEEKDKPPVDFAAIGKTLNGLRGKILPLDLDLQDVSFNLKKDGDRVVELEPSAITHESGEDVVRLSLGRIIDAQGHFTQKQNTELVWENGKLTLDKLVLLPQLGIRDVAVTLPEDGEIAAEAMIRLGGAMLRLDVGKGISDLRLNMTEGEIDFGKVLGGFGLGLPVKGRLTSLSLDMEKFFPVWQTAVGTAEVFVEGFSYAGWDVPELSAGVTLDDGRFSAKLAGKALGSEMSLNGGGDFEREKLETGGFMLNGIAGDLRIAEAGDVLRALDAKLDMGGRFTDFPKSELAGTWNVDLGGGVFSGISVDLTAKATAIEASPIRLDATYAGKLLTIRSLATEGREISGTFDTETQGYKLAESMKDFSTDSIAPWLRGAGISVPGSGVFSLDWEGSGNLLTNEHKGSLSDLSATWDWKQIEGEPARAPISASGNIGYDWPEYVEASDVTVQTEGQTVKLDAKLAGQLLTLEKFKWLDGEQELATGRGTLPVPEDFSKWKEFLENDTRPLDLTINTETLPLAKLRPWVKGLDKIEEKATGKLDLKIGGSLAKPEVDASVEIRDVSVPGQSEIPTTDVTLNIKARDGRAEVNAEAVAPDYAPATLKAEMAFRPKQWAEDPASLMAEDVKGTLDLPRIDLSRFQSLMPGGTELGGVAEGKIDIAGTLGDPKVDGDLKLSGGKLKLGGNAIPALSGIDFDVKANLDQLEIKGAVNDMAGGNIRINGTVKLANGEGTGLGPLDVSVKGTGVPVMRNEFLIVRANADLSVRGTMTDAKVSGEIGIIDSVFYKDMDLIPIGKPFLEPSAASLPRVDTPDDPGASVPAPFNQWTADVVVKTIDPILIRGNLGKGRVDVALRIGGTLGDPKPNGKARLSNGVVRLPFSTLEIREAFLTFTPQTGFDPIVELRGTAEPRPYRVQVYAHGRMSDPQLVLTSQPPLPENEIMTLLATGTTSEGLEDSQAATSRAMQLLIEELRRGRFLFGKQLRPVLGLLDNVDFSLAESDPYDSGTYNSATLKLSEKWYISAGIGAEGDQRVLAIWRLRFR